MMNEEDLLNIIRREIERFHATRQIERHALVTSYDPDKHLAKVNFMPDGQGSGWLPIETGHMGDGFGILVGLTPGKGKGDGGDGDGDQVIVRFQEGDLESGKIVKVVHSDKDKPPKVESGEFLIKVKSGSFMKFDKDGQITIQQAKGQKLHLDKDGGATLSTDNKGITVSSGSATTALTGQNVDMNG
jgi:hypothetical protein